MPKTTSNVKKSPAKKTSAAAKKAPVAAAVEAKMVTAPVAKRSTKIPLGALAAELLGTMVLTTAVLVTSANALVAAITVLTLVVVFGAISGGHFNPAVSIGVFLARKASAWRTLGYVVAQVLGAMLAVIVLTQFIKTGPAITDPSTGLAMTHPFVAQLPTTQWEQFFAEALGALIFGLAIGSNVLGKKQGIEAGFAAGLGLFIGLLVATYGSASILNPAVAIGVGAYTNLWTWLAYLLGPIVGMTVGIWIFKLVQKQSAAA